MAQPSKDSICGHYTPEGFLVPKSARTKMTDTPPFLGEPPQTPSTGDHRPRKRTIKSTSHIRIFPPPPPLESCGPPRFPQSNQNQRRIEPPKAWTPKFVYVRVKRNVIPPSKVDFETYPNNPPPLPPEEEIEEGDESPPPPPPPEEDEDEEEESPPPPPPPPEEEEEDEEEESPPPPPPPEDEYVFI